MINFRYKVKIAPLFGRMKVKIFLAPGKSFIPTVEKPVKLTTCAGVYLPPNDFPITKEHFHVNLYQN